MRNEPDPFRCPAEDAIEIWALQDVLGIPDDDERVHLVHCPLCHEIHSRFVDFYCTNPREAHEYLVARRDGKANRVSIREEEVHSDCRFLWPLDGGASNSIPARPLAISNRLLSGLGEENQRTRSFISTDGTIKGKFDKLTGSPLWSFRLLSEETSFTGRTILRLNDQRTYFQSDDLGCSLLSLGEHTPFEIESIELVPYFAETAFNPADISDDPDLIPDIISIHAGSVGEIVLEQEEGDRGEAILHILLMGMPRSYLKNRVIVALEADGLPPFVEEAIGRDLYFYGIDLFRSLRIWVYLR